MTRPPRWAERLLQWTLPAEDLEFVLGDLEEAFVDVWLPALGPRAARRRYWGLALRSVLARIRSPRRPGLRPMTPTPHMTPGDHLDTLRKDLAFGLRALARRLGFTTTVVLTLALAIGANTAMFTVVDAVLLRPLPYPEPDRLVTLWQASVRDPAGRNLASVPNFRDWRARSETVSEMASYRSTEGWVLTGLGDAEEVSTSAVSEGFFQVFGADLLRGRGISRGAATHQGPREVVVSERFWRDRLGSDPGVLERVLDLEGIPHQVVGVAPRGFSYPEGAELWVGYQPDVDACGRGCVGIEVVGRLTPGATLEGARSEFEGIAHAISDEYGYDPDSRVKVVSLEELTVGHVRRGLFVLLGAVGLVLLIACANIANLLLADGARREGEMATRAALGAGRLRIVRQLLTESALLAALGGTLGVALAWSGVAVARGWLGGALPRGDVADALTLSPGVLLFAFVLVVGSALVFGLAPALGLSRPSLSTLIGREPRGGAVGRARSSLLTVQVALAVVLLLGTGLLLRTLSELRNAPIGFDPAGVIAFGIGVPSSRYDHAETVRFHAELRRRLAELPQVASVGGALGTPLEGVTVASSVRFAEGSEAAPNEDGTGQSTIFRVVTPGYLETLRIPVLRGRAIQESDDIEAPGVVLVSQSTAERWWPGQDPLGKEVRLAASVGLPTRPRRVVGVVGDVRSTSVRADVGAEVYIPNAQSAPGYLTFTLRPRAGSGSLVEPIRDVVRRMDPDVPVSDLHPLAQNVSSEVAQPRLYASLLTAFSTLALTLAGIGLYGIVSYQVGRRYREIGIRIAVGARREDVVGMILGQGMRPAIVGVAIGLGGAAFASSLVEKLLYNVHPGDAASWVGTVVVILVVVLAALVLPARRATRVDPSQALRTD